jgi:hypothetical protein
MCKFPTTNQMQKVMNAKDDRIDLTGQLFIVKGNLMRNMRARQRKEGNIIRGKNGKMA